MPKPWSLLLTCEHGGAKIPAAYRSLLLPAEERDLATHRAWDPGALTIARTLQRGFACPLFASEVSRLLVDLNRSAHHRSCLGLSYRGLPRADQEKIMARYYHPYRQAVVAALREGLKDRSASMLHIALHSFTPVLGGIARRADVGLLYDPGRSSERTWAALIHESLAECAPELRIRRNYPYLGKSDGFTTALRKTFPERRYAGFEIEVNQAMLDDPLALRKVATILLRSLLALKAEGRLASGS